MFSSSVRRAVFTAPPNPIASAAPRSAIKPTLLYRSHQRRLSSSKPSSPADGSKGMSESQAVPALKTRSSRKKSKEVAANSTVKGRDESMFQLPSVPSTQHIAPEQIASSSFFSLHRPISLTNSIPKTVTEDAFAAIFTSRTRTNKPAEVLSTLSNVVRKLDAVTGRLEMVKLGRQQDQWNEETDDIRAGITADSYSNRKSEIQHLDNMTEDAALTFPNHILYGKYRPFHPPPPPSPLNSPESLASGAEILAEPIHEPQHRTYTAVLTIEESTDANGDITYMAHSSPLIAEIEDAPTQMPTQYRDRMNIRQERFREQREDSFGGMWAISVKRQRKLKMKKHKYKKLMKRTRNLRRKLERN